MAKKEKSENTSIFIGKKKSMNYVMADMMVFNEKQPVRLLARVRSISRAVDVAEILRNNFSKGSKYGEVLINTEEVANKDGTNSNVSSMEIELMPPN